MKILNTIGPNKQRWPLHYILVLYEGTTAGEPLSTGGIVAASTIPSSVVSFLVGSLVGALVHHCFTMRRSKRDSVANSTMIVPRLLPTFSVICSQRAAEESGNEASQH